MKKTISLMLALVMSFALVACGQSQTEQSAPPAQAGQASSCTVQSGTTPDAESPVSSEPSADTSAEAANSGKMLVVYFSWSSSGNTETMANVIAEHTGADILRLEPAQAYPTDYNKCGEVAKAERDENARPEIANLPENLDEYDTIFVGYPIWWHTAPMIIGTFLESYDLTDKQIYPFSQSASMDTEQFANSMDFVRASAAGAAVHDGLFVQASDTDGILSYLSENGF